MVCTAGTKTTRESSTEAVDLAAEAVAVAQVGPGAAWLREVASEVASQVEVAGSPPVASRLRWPLVELLLLREDPVVLDDLATYRGDHALVRAGCP
mmetsp:Transcript_43744/g.78673  ORF Transcript_43744/g.78673 Transcript_43744/m.78673 type:complete len:96 (+) Transcript_43744:851-1138(+)